jgi:SAM-dependent methyltransferase
MIGIPEFKRAVNHARLLLQGRLSCYHVALSLVKDQAGLEIGGPSWVFRDWYAPLPIYNAVASLDNCVFSQKTVWESHSESYAFRSDKAAGRTIICDGSDLSLLPDDSYDFILSSHNLEHIANPVKALREWQRIVHPGGALILVLPNYAKTFDHRRDPTTVSHMLDDFNRNTREDDLTHLPEILQLHDLSMDLPAGTTEEFRQRSLRNFTNRCLHHHVFNENNSKELLSAIGIEVLAVETAWPFHIFLLARMP